MDKPSTASPPNADEWPEREVYTPPHYETPSEWKLANMQPEQRERWKRAVRQSLRPEWRDEIAAEQGWRCFYCQRSMCRDKGPLQRTLDHKRPVSRGGRSRRKNIVAACFECNQSKGNMTADEFTARAIEARRAATGTGAVEDESAVA